MSNDWGTTTTVSGGSSTGASGASAPWFWLAIGSVLALIVFALGLLLKPEGIGANLGFWFLSMAAYLGPFAAFVTKELKLRSTLTYYRTSVGSVKTARAIYLIFGIAMSAIFVYNVADELSRIINAVN